MRYLTLILFVVCTSYSQTQELYDIAFSKKENFRVLTFMGGKIPKTFYVKDSTDFINGAIFYLPDTDLNDPEVMKGIEHDEHHPYHNVYLFADKSLDTLIPKQEKIKLAAVADNSVVTKINITGKKFKMIDTFKKEGFYFLLTNPIYSSDGRYAFARISVKQKTTFLGDPWDEYFATITFMFEKMQDGKWKQIGRKDHIIL
ncbi:MAG: hypothetical protein DI539_22040 [Flavobacterium psychrophilum]|nr:MAG: hypothetical protein DI539_22040 [Flavobacterium psychrophilum]